MIVLYEVCKKVLRERGEHAAFQVQSCMVGGKIIDIDADSAIAAARYALPQADSLIYATAQKLGATLWTQDDDFKGLAGVKYFAKLSAK